MALFSGFFFRKFPTFLPATALFSVKIIDPGVFVTGDLIAAGFFFEFQKNPDFRPPAGENSWSVAKPVNLGICSKIVIFVDFWENHGFHWKNGIFETILWLQKVTLLGHMKSPFFTVFPKCRFCHSWENIYFWPCRRPSYLLAIISRREFAIPPTWTLSRHGLSLTAVNCASDKSRSARHSWHLSPMHRTSSSVYLRSLGEACFTGRANQAAVMASHVPFGVAHSHAHAVLRSNPTYENARLAKLRGVAIPGPPSV